MSAETLAFHIKAAKLPPPVLEYRFHTTRRWRADFAWPERKLLVEYEGGVYANGRHTRGKGYTLDCEKYNAGALMGYTVLRFTSEHVTSGYALETIQAALQGSN